MVFTLLRMTARRDSLTIQPYTVNKVLQQAVKPQAPDYFQGDQEDPLAIRPELLEEAIAFLDEYAEDFTALASL
jgi:hypothetical protein